MGQVGRPRRPWAREWGQTPAPRAASGCRLALPRSSRASGVSGPELHRPLHAAKPRPHLDAEGGGAGGEPMERGGAQRRWPMGVWEGWAGAPRNQCERAGRGRAGGLRANGRRTGTLRGAGGGRLPRRRVRGRSQLEFGSRRPAGARGSRAESRSLPSPAAAPREAQEPGRAWGPHLRPPRGGTPASPASAAIGGSGRGCLLPARWARSAEVSPGAGAFPWQRGAESAYGRPWEPGRRPAGGAVPSAPGDWGGGAGSPASG